MYSVGAVRCTWTTCALIKLTQLYIYPHNKVSGTVNIIGNNMCIH